MNPQSATSLPSFTSNTAHTDSLRRVRSYGDSPASAFSPFTTNQPKAVDLSADIAASGDISAELSTASLNPALPTSHIRSTSAHSASSLSSLSPLCLSPPPTKPGSHMSPRDGAVFSFEKSFQHTLAPSSSSSSGVASPPGLSPPDSNDCTPHVFKPSKRYSWESVGGTHGVDKDESEMRAGE